MSVLVVTGTGPGVGTTVVAAAVAGLAAGRGSRVAAVLPAQTGPGDGAPGRLRELARLSGVEDLHELARYPPALSPAAAARESGHEPLDLAIAVDRVLRLVDRDLVLVLCPGGLLVRYDDDGLTPADLARALRAPVLVVAGLGPGAVNAAALTLEVAAGRGLSLAGVVVGSAPSPLPVAARDDLHDLETLAARPLLGVLPQDAAALSRPAFLAAARAGLGPQLGGVRDARATAGRPGSDRR